MQEHTAVPQRRPARRWRRAAAVPAGGLMTLAAIAGLDESAHAATVPTPDHVVVVVFENHGYSQIIGNSNAPYFNSLANGGANFMRLRHALR